MPIRRVELPSLGRSLSNLMAAPSSAQPDTHEAGLDAYRSLGGNAIHLHGEGGEEHSRRVVGEWLRSRGVRAEFFICTQICHDSWDEVEKKPIYRFAPEAVREDVIADLQLLGADYLDLVYLDDHPSRPFESVIEALRDEMAIGHVRGVGVRNWMPDRIRAAHAHARALGMPGISALLTTELALPVATAPLWPEYLPFDDSIRQVVLDLGLAVLAHASDICLGECLFGDEDPFAGLRPHWVDRWDPSANSALVQRVRLLAAERDVTPREIGLTWILSRPFPVVTMIGLPELVGPRRAVYERASQLTLSEAELAALNNVRRAA